MVYAYDKSLPMPVADLYDTQIMAMAVNAAKDMYEKGLQLIKDFQKDYGDFISPFAKDMARYGEMVGGVRDIINNLYANGIDQLRSAEGRAAVAQAIRSIDPAEMNAMRANAKLGYAYQDALGKLNAAGKYDPQMNEYFLREQGLPSFNDFSTAENGTWGLSSPVEATSLRDLTSAGFAHRTAHDLTPEEAKATLGKAYDPRAKYTGWTYNDLFDTAGTLVPGLQGDWRGRYFRELSKQKALANNPNATEDDINRQFQSDVAESNLLWIIEPKGSLSDYYQQESNNLQRARLNWEKQKYADEQRRKAQEQEETNLDGISLYERWYAKGAANALSQGGTKYNWQDMPNNYGAFGNNAYQTFWNVGLLYKHNNVSASEIVNNDELKEDFVQYVRSTGKVGPVYTTELVNALGGGDAETSLGKVGGKTAGEWVKSYNNHRSLRTERDAISGFKNKFSIPMDERAVVKSIGSSVSGNDRVIVPSLADIDRIFSTDDIITNTAGYQKRHLNKETANIRAQVESALNSPQKELKVTFTPVGTGYASMQKNTGSFEVMPELKVQIRDSEDNVVYDKNVYYNIGLGSDNNAGGAYLSNNPILNDGVLMRGSITDPSNPIHFVMQPQSVGKSYNLYPSYDRWLEYGIRDTRATKDFVGTSPDTKPSTL